MPFGTFKLMKGKAFVHTFVHVFALHTNVFSLHHSKRPLLILISKP